MRPYTLRPCPVDIDMGAFSSQKQINPLPSWGRKESWHYSEIFLQFTLQESVVSNTPKSQASKEQQVPEACPPILAFHLLLGQRPGLQR